MAEVCTKRCLLETDDVS